MSYSKLASVNYDTPEQAEAMAAQINANSEESAVRAVCNGCKMEVIPANPSVSALMGVFSKTATGLASLFGKSTASSKSTASA